MSRLFLTGFLVAVVVPNYLFATFLSKAPFINFGFGIRFLGGICLSFFTSILSQDVKMFFRLLVPSSFSCCLVAYVWFAELNVD